MFQMKNIFSSAVEDVSDWDLILCKDRVSTNSCGWKQISSNSAYQLYYILRQTP